MKYFLLTVQFTSHIKSHRSCNNQMVVHTIWLISIKLVASNIPMKMLTNIKKMGSVSSLFKILVPTHKMFSKLSQK